MLKLLVLQPTPFCNIACDYCYLPDRGERGRMSLGVLAQALKRVADSGWLGPKLDVAWHAGEPLVVPVDYYAAALELFRQCLPATVVVRHGIQTNATLIDPDWCRFFVEHRIDVGVSLDGPADLHDAHRRTRAGRGTHAAVLRGVRLLQAHGVPFHVICVLTDAALAQPDTVIDFFLGEGIGRIGFNIEELDGANRHSSIQGTAAERAYRRFMTRVMQRVRTEPERLQVRELTSVLEALASPGFGTYDGNDQNEPFAILSIGWRGEITTFSPELLGTAHPTYGSFTFGNVATHALAQVAADPCFQAIRDAIAGGVQACKQTCDYFPICLGGAPANKLGELGTLAGTRTTHCRLTQQISDRRGSQ